MRPSSSAVVSRAMRDAGFGQQLGRVRADDVDAEDLVVFLLRDDLDEAVGLAEDPCFTRCREREFADLYVIACFFRFRFGQADAGDFGVAVGAVRDEVLLDRLDLFAGDLFDDQILPSTRGARATRCR